MRVNEPPQQIRNGFHSYFVNTSSSFYLSIFISFASSKSLASMPSLLIGTHLSTCHFIPKHPLRSQSSNFLFHAQFSIPSKLCFGSAWFSKGSQRWLGNGMLPRAEYKAKDSASSPVQQERGQPNSEKQFQVSFGLYCICTCSYLLSSFSKVLWISREPICSFCQYFVLIV